MESWSGRYEVMGQYAESDIVLESNSLLRAVFSYQKTKKGSNNSSVCICRNRRLYGLVSWRTGWFSVCTPYLMNVGSSRIGELLDYLGVKTVTGTTWESGTINGMLCNEKYKGDFHLQKYYTPENKRNHTRKNNGEVQSYYISENHEPIVSPEVWEKVQEVREQRKRDRNIGQDSTMKFQKRYPLSGMLICPYCGKTLRRRQVYKKKIQWLCSTYIEKGVKACKGIRIDDAELQGLNITEQTVIEEVVKNGKKHYCYTSKADFDCGIRNSTVSAEIEEGSVLPSVNRPRRTVIKL